jgi:hypothetical protein
VHDINTLTFFDDELSTDFLRPIDATEARVFPPSASSGSVPASVAFPVSHSSSKSSLVDMDHDEQGSVDSSRDGDYEGDDRVTIRQPGKRIDQEGFNLSSFFQKAKSIVGEILHPMAYDVQDNRSLAETRNKSKVSVAFSESSGDYQRDLISSQLLSTSEEMAVYAKSIQVDDSSQRAYIRYCDDFIEPEAFIDEKNRTSEYDFKKSLWAMTVDYEDVKGMENLAAGSHISDVVSTGVYEGMQQHESALLATALSALTIVFVEPDLQPDMSEVSPQPSPDIIPKISSSTQPPSRAQSPLLLASPSADLAALGKPKLDFIMSPDERVPAKHKAQLINKRASTKFVVELSDESKNKMDEIWHANTNFSQVGLEEEIYSGLNKYLYSQNIYGHEVDPDRLAKR